MKRTYIEEKRDEMPNSGVKYDAGKDRWDFVYMTAHRGGEGTDKGG